MRSTQLRYAIALTQPDESFKWCVSNANSMLYCFTTWLPPSAPATLQRPKNESRTFSTHLHSKFSSSSFCVIPPRYLTSMWLAASSDMFGNTFTCALRNSWCHCMCRSASDWSHSKVGCMPSDLLFKFGNWGCAVGGCWPCLDVRFLYGDTHIA